MSVTQADSYRVFLLSPAYAGGKRAHMLMSGKADFDLARRLRGPGRVAIGEVFTFLSGLYFRGKIAYANAFARPVRDAPGVLVITPTRGLVDAATAIDLDDLREFAEVEIDGDDPRYRLPLEQTAAKLAKQLRAEGEVVLLGSIATGKYAGILLQHLGDRLHFPADFVGRGDMSRGGLLLRCAVDGRELNYIPIAGAVRKGKRPPKLEPRRYSAQKASGEPSGWRH